MSPGENDRPRAPLPAEESEEPRSKQDDADRGASEGAPPPPETDPGTPPETLTLQGPWPTSDGDTVSVSPGGDDTVFVPPTAGEEPTGAPPPTASPPESVGAYRIEKELGRGGMGVVYVAEDPRLRRRIALKVLPKAIASNAQALDRFQREARLLAALNHPNIATIYSLEEAEPQHFFTMELVTGETLAHRIARGRLSVDETLRYGRHISRALQAAHARGVIHRDLKPANVMISDDDEVKILDFGIATAMAGETAERVGIQAQCEEIAGTPGYMSPEQIRGELTDHRTDIWALGCLIFECLAGLSPFARGQLRHTLDATLHEPVNPEELPDDTPDALRDLILRCVEKSLDARLPSAQEARRILDDLSTRRTVETMAGRVDREATPHNLPRQLTTFVGRERQLQEVESSLEETPLLTLTGTGGSGKTRLAVEVARRVLPRFSHGVWIVELAPLKDPALVASTVASVLGIKEEANRPVIETVVDHLKDREVLLLLDNCEHLLGAAAEVTGRLLQACERVRIFASSREALGVPGEKIYQIPSMGLPPTRPHLRASDLAEVESVRLFVERATAVKPAFELNDENADAVAQIVRRLDGIPLALELAAARVRVLAVQELAKRLADRFRLLTGGSKTALPHHQTLRATIDWSYDHLSEEEQLLLRRLSIFVGGWDLESGEAVCSAEGIEDWEVLDYLTNLVDKSLVEVNAGAADESGTVRYRLLESVRQYAFELLTEKGEREPVRERHRDHFLALAERAQPQLGGPEQAHWFELLEQEHDNLRAALQACSEEESGGELGLRLASALGPFWLVRGHWSEGRQLTEQMLEHPGARDGTEARARALGWAGSLAGIQADHARARRLSEESLVIHEKREDRAGIATSLNDLGLAVRREGDQDTAREYLERSLAIRRELGDRHGVAASLNNLGLLAIEQGDFETADAYYEESLEILRELGNQQGIAVSLNSRGSVAFGRGDFEAARDLYGEALAISREIGNRRTERNALGNLGQVAHKLGDLPEARRLFEESLQIKQDLGDRFGMAVVLDNMARVALEQEDDASAQRYCQQGLELAAEIGATNVTPDALLTAARVAASQERHAAAVRLLGAAEAAREAVGTTLEASEREVESELVESLRGRLGSEEFIGGWAEGRELDLEAARRLFGG